MINNKGKTLMIVYFKNLKVSIRYYRMTCLAAVSTLQYPHNFFPKLNKKKLFNTLSAM